MNASDRLAALERQRADFIARRSAAANWKPQRPTPEWVLVAVFFLVAFTAALSIGLVLL